MIPIEENVRRVCAEIERAAAQAGRDAKEIRLCAATKMNDASAVQRAIAAGVAVCGENRVQELQEKLPQGAYRGAEVHFIGHLQKNKAKFVVGQVSLIESVDNLELLQLIDRLARERGLIQDVLLEVNIGLEEAKSGFRPDEVAGALEKAASFGAIRVRGLMAIPPRADATGENGRFFAQMQQLYVDMRAKKYDNASMEILSMGMSGDFACAIAYGSTEVRVGTAIFGPRNYGPAAPAPAAR